MKAALTSWVSLIPGIVSAREWNVEDIEKSIRIEGNARGSDHLCASLLLPEGPWMGPLLDGIHKITANSYVTLAEGALYADIELTNID